jgi:threonylcarbamoyladenosine tRNA methylthiotransferase MtaB
MRHYTITTLGCKVNQCESAALGHLLEERGFFQADDSNQPDVVIINTCTVTGRAAMQSRQAIRQAARRNPRAAIVVTGCYAQTAPDEITAIQDVDVIVGHEDKLAIGTILDQLFTDTPRPILSHRHISACRQFAALPSVAAEGRTRAFLKIQDGCNTMCTYCIVPHARGRSRSMPLTDVMKHLQRLGNDGFREVVLTGIHLGAYGTDLDPPTALTHLLKEALEQHCVDRIRLSSIEPTEIDQPLIDLVADSRAGLCPHLHIPLQSGDDGILERMGRPYSRAQFGEIVRSIRNRLPRAAIGADILVGFPGEDEAAFEQTFSLIENLPVTYLHVFPFSPRKGTPAARFKNKVSEHVIKKRCGKLRRLGEQKKRDFFCTQIGQQVKVLVETNADAHTGLPKGLSDNYIPVLIADASAEINEMTEVVIETVATDMSVVGRTQSFTSDRPVCN